LFGVELPLRLVFRVTEKMGSTGSTAGRVILDDVFRVLIPRIDAGPDKPFVFYIYNMADNEFASTVLPDTIQAKKLGSDEKLSIRLIEPPQREMTLPPSNLFKAPATVPKRAEASPPQAFKVSLERSVDRLEPNPAEYTHYPSGVPISQPAHLSRRFNINVENISDTLIKDGQAFIVAICKRIERQPALSEQAEVSFLEIPLSEPLQMEPRSFDLYPLVPKKIELVKANCVDNERLIRTHGWPSDIEWVFQYRGTYRFKIVVSAGGVSAVPICVQVRHQGLWDILSATEVPWEEPVKMHRATTEQWLRTPQWQ
jgi:hypothetical protein